MLGHNQLMVLLPYGARETVVDIVEPKLEPSVWATIRFTSDIDRYRCWPVFKTPAESFVLGIDVSGPVGAATVNSVVVAYLRGHGLTFDTVADWLNELQAVAFHIAGGRRNTRHVLVVTVVTSAGQVIKIDVPIEVVE